MNTVAASVPPMVPERSASARIGRKVFVGFALFYLAFLPPGIYSIDGNSMLAVAEALVTRHTIAIEPPAAGTIGADGRLYSNWYPLLSLIAVPFVAVAQPVSKFFHVPLHYLAAVIAGALPATLMAGSAAFVMRIAFLLGSTLERARCAALTFGFGTVAMAYARSFYAEPLLALLGAAALYFAIKRGPRDILLASILAMLAILAKPTGILVGPLLAAYLCLRRSSILYAALPVIGTSVGLLLFCAYNNARFGSPWNFGPAYEFSARLLKDGVPGLLVSPGRGLLWYSPVAVLGFWGAIKLAKTMWMEAALIVATFVAFLVLHSAVPYWHAGWAWGPRYLLPALPALIASTAFLEDKWRKALVTLACVGVLINAPTLFSYYERYYAEATEAGVSEHALLWSPAKSPALHAWGAAIREVRDARHSDPRQIFQEAGQPSSTIAGSRALRVVALWWWVLPIVHIPRLAGAMLSLVLALWGCLILWRARPIAETARASQPAGTENTKESLRA